MDAKYLKQREKDEKFVQTVCRLIALSGVVLFCVSVYYWSKGVQPVAWMFYLSAILISFGAAPHWNQDG